MMACDVKTAAWLQRRAAASAGRGALQMQGVPWAAVTQAVHFVSVSRAGVCKQHAQLHLSPRYIRSK